MSQTGRQERGLGLLRCGWFLRCQEFCASLELLEFPSWVKGVDCEKEEKKTQEAQLRSEEPKTLSTCHGKGHESLEGCVVQGNHSSTKPRTC